MKYLKDDYLTTVCKFNNIRLVEEIRALESILDSDLGRDAMFFDDLLFCYDNLRDECVERVYHSGNFRILKN